MMVCRDAALWICVPQTAASMNVPTLIRIDSSEKLVIDRPSMIIGRSRRRADFQIDDATVSAVHCELQVGNSGLTVRDMSRHGTLVNGRRVDQAKLHEGDILEIVGYRFHVTFENSNLPPRKAPAQEEWFVRLAGIELGPMPWDELTGMVERKELQKQDFVRAVTEVAWRNAGEIRALFAAPQADEAIEPETGEAEEVSEGVLEARLVNESETETIPTTAELGAELQTEVAVPSESERQIPADRDDRKQPSPGDSSRSDTTPAEANLADVDNAPSVVNFDGIKEEEVAAVTDEAVIQPTIRLGENTDNPLDDTIVPVQDATVTDPAAFRQEPPKTSPEPEEAPAKPSPAPPVKTDGEKLPQTGWMYRSDSGEFGPVDLAGLAELAEAGLLVPGNLVKRPDNGNWLSADEIPGLFDGDDADPADEGATYDDSSFADLDDELSTLSPPVKEIRSTPASRPLTASPSLQPVKQPVPPPLPALAPRPSDRPGIFTRLTSPFPGLAGSVMAHPRVAAGIAVALVAIWLFWPGADEHEAYVSGQIQLDGKPLSNAAIMFTDPDAGWGASASLDENGEFEISTLRGGLQPGRYLISLMPERPEPEHVVKELQRQYLQQTEGLVEPSGMMLEGMPKVPDSEGEGTPVELPPGTIPMRFRSVDTSELDATIKVGDNKVRFNLASS